MEDVAPFIVAIVLILTVGGVAILRPISKRAGLLLEAMARDKAQPKRPSDDTHRIVELMEAMHARLDRLEERQDFTDSLMGGAREGKTLPRARAETRDTTV